MNTQATEHIPEIAPATPRTLRSRHLLGIDGLDADEIFLILDTAEAMKEIGTRAIKKVPTLRGRTVVNCFEPGTRTRTSSRSPRSASARHAEHRHRNVERDQGRVPPRYDPQHRGDVTRHDRDASWIIGRAASPRPDVPVDDCERRGRHARASDAGTAGRVHDPCAQGTAGRLDGCDHWRLDAQPCAALQHPAAAHWWAPRCESAVRRRCCRQAWIASA